MHYKLRTNVCQHKIEHIFVNKCLLFLFQYDTILLRKIIGGNYGTG